MSKTARADEERQQAFLSRLLRTGQPRGPSCQPTHIGALTAPLLAQNGHHRRRPPHSAHMHEMRVPRAP